MKKVVEPFTSLTSWTPSGGASAWALNQHPSHIADGLPASIIFQFPAGGSVSKAISVDVSGYTELILHGWSRSKSRWSYQRPGDFAYKLKIGTGKEYYLPFYGPFCDVAIALDGFTPITEITLTALHTDEDYVVLSGGYAIKDEYPLDIFTSVKEGIEAEIAGVIGKGYYVGKVTGSTGDTALVIPSPRSHVERYSMLLIDDGTNTERHIVEAYDEESVTFSQLKDGFALLHDYANADLYVVPDVNFGRAEEEIILPGVSIWGMAPEPVMRSSDLAFILDTYNLNGTTKERREWLNLKYPILIDCEARTHYELAQISEIVRHWLGRRYAWINGRKHDVEFNEPPVAIDADESVEMLPKIQYTIGIEAREEREIRRTLPITTDMNQTVNIVGG